MVYLMFKILKADIISITIAYVLLSNYTFASSWTVVLTTRAWGVSYWMIYPNCAIYRACKFLTEVLIHFEW